MATKKPGIKLLFFSPYFYPYISGLTQYPYRLFTESGLPLDVTCLTFKHIPSLSSRTLVRDLATKESVNNASLDFSVAPLLRNDLEVRLHLTILRMPFWLRISKGFISPQSLSYFWNETKKNDVVMINLPSIEGLFLALYAKIQNKPIISLLHCEVLLPFSPLNILVNFALNCGVFFQLILSKTILIYTKDYYEKKWMYSFFKNKMQVILPPVHNVKPDNAYADYLAGIKKGYRHVIGFCGRVAAEKGIGVLIESITTLKSVFLLIAGPTGKDVIGEEEYFKKIEKLLIGEKIPHLFLGTLSGGRLSAFYKALDVLALPSLNKTEAFGMVQVEAMLQGTPVVASNLSGVRVPIQLTKMGILTTQGRAIEVTQGLHTILQNRKKYSNPQLIHNAKAVFDSQKTYASIYTTIQQCVK